MNINKIVFCVVAYIFFINYATAQTADITEGCAPLEVKFTNPGTSSTHYWDFKDGVTSNLPSPTNIFSDAGTYEVEYRESASGPIVGTVSITVHPDPEVTISASDQISCSPHNVTFQNTTELASGIVVTNTDWVFGDGQGAQGVASPSHTYTGLGTYDVSLTLETNIATCNKTVLFEDFIETINSPTASMSSSPSSTFTCSPSLDVQFIDNSSGERPLLYNWNFGNGNTSTSSTPPSQSYTEGQYIASLNVTYENISGCSSTTSRGISVGSPEPTIEAPDSVCLNSNFGISTTLPGNYVWDFGAGALPAVSTQQSVSLRYSTPGYHTVSLTVSNGGCSGTVTKDIYVDEVTIDVTSLPDYKCEEPGIIEFNTTSNKDDLSYQWAFSRTAFYPDIPLLSISFNLTTESTMSYEVPKEPEYGRNVLQVLFSQLEVTSLSSGCKASASVIDTVYIPNALPMPNRTKGCVPLTVTFSDSSTFDGRKPLQTWDWRFGDGDSQVNTNDASVTHTYDTPGEYEAELIVTNSVGCKDTSYAVVIEVGDKIPAEVDFSVDKTEICRGEEVRFTNESTSTEIDAYHYSTEGNRSFHCSNEDDVSWTYNHTVGPQDVSLTVDYNGCFTTVTKTGLIDVKGPLPIIDYTASCDNPKEYSFTNIGTGTVSPTWTFDDGTFATTDDVVHTYTNSGDYLVRLTAVGNDGCGIYFDSTTIKVREVESVIALDTHLCINVPYTLDASNSVDVDGSCRRGYTWQFPTIDQRPITLARATRNFTFTEAGNHQIRLIAEDVNGCVDTSTFDFKVYDMEVEAKADDESICVPSLVNFTNETTSDTLITDWLWDFDDTETSTEKSPSHTFAKQPQSGGFNPTIYRLKLTATDILGCKETYNFTIQKYIPSGKVTISDRNICVGDEVKIESDDYTAGGSNLEFAWDFDNGETSTDQINQVQYNNPGLFNVALRTTEVATGCKDSIFTTVSVQSYPTAGITTNVEDLDVLCAPQNIFFQDASSSATSLGHFWDFGNSTTSNASTYSLFYPKGQYTVEHIVNTSFGCRDTAYASYNVLGPEGDFDIDRNTICKSESIAFSIKDTVDVGSFTWAFGDGTTLNDVGETTHQYNFHPESGQTVAKLIIRGEDDICPVEINKSIFIHQVIADFRRKDGIDTTLCVSEGAFPLTNTSIAANEFLWDFGDGSTSTENNPQHTFPGAGYYDVQLFIANNSTGCKDTITKVAAVFDNPTVEVLGDSICQGDVTSMEVTTPVASNTYEWSPITGISSSTGTYVDASPNQTTTYTVLVTDTNSCTGSDTPTIVVIEPIDIYDWDTTIVIGDKATLPVNGQEGVYLFTWLPEGGLSCLDCNYPVVQPLEDITYQLEVKDIKDCFVSNAEYNIVVKPETFVKLPTTFTPNEDGINDVIFVEGWGIKELLEFKIFNRWGQVVYESLDREEGWDGTFNGKPQNSDVYVYQVKVLTWRDEEIYQEGYINLLH